MKEYSINLDQTPDQRWNDIIWDNKEIFSEISKEIPFIISANFSPLVSKLWKISHPLVKIFPIATEYKKELKGISKITSKYGVGYDNLVLFNILVDILSKCTSIVTFSVQGQLHLRNLDWDLPLLKKLLILVNFEKNGIVIYRAITFIGCVGILTGMRPFEYSISFNYRKLLQSSIFPKFSHYYSSMVIRSMLENKKDFHEATIYIKSCKLNSSGYFILCGTKLSRGIIIARGSPEYSETMINGFIVQTNNDYNIKEIDQKWADDDPLLVSSLVRKKSAISMLSLNKCTTFNFAKEILSSFPINNEKTIFSCIMNPSTNKIYVL